MYCPTSGNSVNDVLKRAVMVQARCGQNRTGAIETLAAWLGVSSRIVKMRINDEIVGEPRSKGLLAARCWDFLDMIAQRERAWIESLAVEVEQNRLRLQMNLPLDRNSNGIRKGDGNAAARRVERDENELAAARRALASYRSMKTRS